MTYGVQEQKMKDKKFSKVDVLVNMCSNLSRQIGIRTIPRNASSRLN